MTANLKTVGLIVAAVVLTLLVFVSGEYYASHKGRLDAVEANDAKLSERLDKLEKRVEEHLRGRGQGASQ